MIHSKTRICRKQKAVSREYESIRWKDGAKVCAAMRKNWRLTGKPRIT